MRPHSRAITFILSIVLIIILGATLYLNYRNKPTEQTNPKAINATTYRMPDHVRTAQIGADLSEQLPETKLIVTNPSGQDISQLNQHTLRRQNGFDTYDLSNPEPGNWTVEIINKNKDTNVEVFFLVLDRDDSQDAKQAPTAIISTSLDDTNLQGSIGQEVIFNGNYSVDYDSIITNYEWDLNNDGKIDYTGASPVVRHTFKNPYQGPIQLIVTDEDGLTDSTSIEITIQ